MKKMAGALLVLCFWALSGEAAPEKNNGAQQTTHKKDRPAITVLKQQTVVSADIQANELTVKGKDGAEQKIPVIPATKVRKGGRAISLSGISAGDVVTVYFKRAKDGRKIPSTVKVMEKGRRRAGLFQ